MDKKKHIVDQISRSVDADVKTTKRITSLMREALADIEERDKIMAEIGTQSKSKIDEQCIMYYTKMNQVDGENLTNLQALLDKLEAIVHKKMGYLKKIIEM